MRHLIKFYSLLVLIGISLNINAQTYVSSTYLKKYTKAFFQTNYPTLPASFEVDLYRIKYNTKNTKGENTVASGLVCLPDVKTQGYPLLVYCHGTVGSAKDVPSYLSFENILPSIYTSLGFISIAPDYLGLGDNEGIHPYVHAASEASASADMMSASLEFLNTKGYKTNKDVFLSGYSQGGHAGMALHSSLEKDSRGFTLKAAAHMSGPYSISESMKELLLSEKEYSLPAYAANVSLSYNLVYNIFPDGDINKFFKPTYGNMIMKYANREVDLWELNEEIIDSLKKQFGKVQPKRMLQDDILAAILNNPEHPVNLALKDNDVYNFKSTIPTLLIYCTADDQVAYTNALLAEKKLKENGSSNVKSEDVNPIANHTECVNPAVTRSLFHFLPYINITNTNEANLNEVTIYPNPAHDFISFKSDEEIKEIWIYDGFGKIYTYAYEKNNMLNISSLNNGLYILTVKYKNDHISHHKFIKD
ncbi:MAG: hypothetical protein RLZZ546_1927 [Bacteroidota bacterium]|jgi:predicted esterase